MKKVFGTIVIAIAAFAGVVGALQIDHVLNKPAAAPSTIFTDSLPAKHVSFDTATPAPFDFRAAAKAIMPAVVSVDKRERVMTFFSDEEEIVPTGTGSGVIISKDGYILTNQHVVSHAAQVQVRLSDGKTYGAQVVGEDVQSDLAVLKIKANNLTPAALGDSSKLEIGEWVIAVGNPLGYSNTVSVGVVSSLKRTLTTQSGGVLLDTIQTDAAINSGNSGGALTNSLGQVVGINSAIVSNTGGNIGIGFAIPINRAKRVVDDIIKYGRVKYGDPGLNIYPRGGLLQDQRNRAFYLEKFNVEAPQQGLIVRQVDANGPAAKQGIKELDVLLKIENITLNEPTDLTMALADRRPGEKVSVDLWSAGKKRTVTLVLSDIATF